MPCTSRSLALSTLAVVLALRRATGLCIWSVPGSTPNDSWQQEALLRPSDGSATVAATAWSPDGSKAVSVGDAVRVWQVAGQNTSAWRQMRVLEKISCMTMGTMKECMGDDYFAVAWSPDGERIAFGGAGGKLHIWSGMSSDAADWHPQHVIRHPEGHINAVEWSADSSRVAFGGKGSTLALWDVTARPSQWHKVATFGNSSTTETLSAIAWSPDNRKIAFSSSSGAAVWSVESAGSLCKHLVTLPMDQTTTLGWTTDGSRLVVGSLSGLIRTWHLDGSSAQAMEDLPKQGPVERMAVSSGKMAFGVQGGLLEIWDVSGVDASQWQLTETIGVSRSRSHINALSFSPDGTRIIFGGAGTVCEVPEVPQVHILRRVAKATLATVWVGWTILGAAVLLLMLVSLGKVLHSYANPGAALVVATLALSAVAAVVYLAATSPYIGHELTTFFAPVALPGLLNMSLNIIGHFTNGLHFVFVHGVELGIHVHSWSWSMFSLFRNFKTAIRIYTCTGPAQHAKIMGVIVGDSPFLAKGLLSECPEAAGTVQSEWARALAEAMESNQKMRIKMEQYESLIAASEGKRATLCDLLRFVPAYFCCLLRSFPPSLSRRVWLERAKRKMVAHKDSADEAEQNGWQLLIDQYDWYKVHGLCFVDVMADLVHRSPRTASVMRLWRAVDWALSFLPRLLFTPLWTPSPEKRVKELESRLRIVNALASGRQINTS
mmetsp:Transcript_35237/g.76976  ORF Transcript_35237/g.76976 Transcript_35237/m.76976 type:complete len:718 (-) Transcript_35237:113-2266(-)|eukprot:CAMPEP_0170592886 /NCGR_PEP_ID=MMETSP0224-20130122/13157_1 /TAXON_ID=285029 /ORGANISM="Togula jolla, Strain CCCM 725" /LENGTH=717 /DNA_ID=CAMNT_0010916809 /DNA_START=77 /DNA_END=2230 /DNA_ORIENTATION=-